MINTNTLIYKITSFFRKLFRAKNFCDKEDLVANNQSLNDFPKKVFNKMDLAESLLKGNTKVEDLTDEEVNSMTEYFINDIKKIDVELARTKGNIERMKNKLKETRIQ